MNPNPIERPRNHGVDGAKPGPASGPTLKPRFETALITGGSTGIGRALAHRLAAQGTRVVICARRAEPLEEARSAYPERIFTLQADVSNPSVAAAVVEEAQAKVGPLTLVVANAASGGSMQRAAKLQTKEVIAVLQTNVVGACATLTAAIPQMVANGRGYLVGISSIAATRGFPRTAAYCASKAALSTFLESLRVDLRGTGIKVVDIRPGYVATPMTEKNKFKMPFILGADAAAERIMAAVEDERPVYMFPWPIATAARLVRLVPNWAYDRACALARGKFW